jgi:polyphosphate kinase
MSKQSRNPAERFINRELSWLEFNDRVLREGLSADVPLLERFKYLAIVSSNLDEAFMIRVAGLRQQREAAPTRRDPSGMTPDEQLQAFSHRAHRLVDEQTAGIRDALAELRREGLAVLDTGEPSEEQAQFLKGYFAREVAPVLTPLAMESLEPKPLLPGLQLHVAVVLTFQDTDGPHETIVVVPVPTCFSRFVKLPGKDGVELARLEELIAAHIGLLFPAHEVSATVVFRITRDADVAIADDDAEDLLAVVAEAVLDRRRRAPVRLEITARPDPRLRKWLLEWLALGDEEVYEIDGMLDAVSLWQIANWPGFERLRVPDWPAQPPQGLVDQDDLFEAIREDDVLLVHPYESFDPIIRLLEQAAADPHVLAIKQTLYRTSGDSPIVDALIDAAEAGKQVVALVELKARFDEQANIKWARALEKAGVHVVYGLVGLKTHCKTSLVVRQEGSTIRRYCHIGTGNYNPKTARLYEDVGILTAEPTIGADLTDLFNVLTGYARQDEYRALLVAPYGVRKGIVDRINLEIERAQAGEPSGVRIKVNSLVDEQVIDALYRASQAGVPVDVVVRGICGLKPGVKGLSENIRVRSILGRFLEHSRVFHFVASDEYWIGSADMMHRNLDRRVEVALRVADPRLTKQLGDMFESALDPHTRCWVLRSDGEWEPSPSDGSSVRDHQMELLHRHGALG